MNEEEKQEYIRKTKEAKPFNEKQRELVKAFIDGLENNDIQKADESLTAMKKMSVPEWNDNIFKERVLFDLSKFLDNDVAQPFLKEYFDMTIREGVGKWAGHANNLIQYSQQRLSGCIFDGVEDIIYFLRAYHIARKERAAQGKNMFVPESFAYCPYLRDVADGVFRDENGYIIEKRDLEKERVVVERYYKDYSESGQIRERSVYEGEDVGIWGFNYRDRVEFQHFTKDGKDDTEMELAREKVRQRYWRNRNNNAGIGVATADEIARMKISGEETRDITWQVGEELHWPVRNRIGSKLDKIHKEGMEKIKKLREQGL